MVSFPPGKSSGGLASQVFKILVLPGDHAGPEVMAEALKVLEVVRNSLPPNVSFDLSHDIVGGISIDTHGVPITDEVLARAQESDAVLFGSVGGPEWLSSWWHSTLLAKVYPDIGYPFFRPNRVNFKTDKFLGVPVQGNYIPESRVGIAQTETAYQWPCKFYSQSLLPLSPLRPEIANGTNFILLRENCGGAYFGPKKEEADYASDTWEYSTPEIERCCHVAAALAKTLGRDGSGRAEGEPAVVWSSDKANVLASGRLWRRVTGKVFSQNYPEIELKHQLADSLSMLMVKNPKQFNGVIHTENTFGDMLSDQAGGIVGTLGVLPSASLCGVPGSTISESAGKENSERCNGIYEPVHGSAPDIAGKGQINPIAQILSLALLLRYSCAMPTVAAHIETAVERVLDDKVIGGLQVRTADLGGPNSTSEVGDAVCEVLTGLLRQK